MSCLYKYIFAYLWDEDQEYFWISDGAKVIDRYSRTSKVCTANQNGGLSSLSRKVKSGGESKPSEHGAGNHAATIS
jgi:hypothetical protein